MAWGSPRDQYVLDPTRKPVVNPAGEPTRLAPGTWKGCVFRMNLLKAQAHAFNLVSLPGEVTYPTQGLDV